MEIVRRAEARSRGLTRYFTGKKCRYGHVDERNVITSRCMRCERERQRRLREIYGAGIRERSRHANRRYYQNNIERERARSRLKMRKVQQENPELLRAQRRIRRLRDPEKTREKARVDRNNRRTRKLAIANTFGRAEWRVLAARSPRCHWCKRPFNAKRRPTHDHVVPLSRGGANTMENSCCACGECNAGKRDRLTNPVTGQGILL